MKKIKKRLDFFNVLDYNGKVSITNVAMIGLFTKVMMAPTIDYPSVVALVTVCLNYVHKRGVSEKSRSVREESTHIEAEEERA